MLEFLRIFGIFIAATSFVLAIFVFFRLKVPSAIAYFSSNAGKRLKEYQRTQRNYLKGSGKSISSKARNNDSTGTLTDMSQDTGTATMTDINGTATMTQTDGDFANALYYAQTTTMLLDEN